MADTLIFLSSSRSERTACRSHYQNIDSTPPPSSSRAAESFRLLHLIHLDHTSRNSDRTFIYQKRADRFEPNRKVAIPDRQDQLQPKVGRFQGSASSRSPKPGETTQCRILSSFHLDIIRMTCTMSMQALWGISSGKGSPGEFEERSPVGRASEYSSPCNIRFCKGTTTRILPFSCRSTLFFLSDGDVSW